MLDFIDSFVKHKDRIRSARPSTALTKIIQEIQTFLGTAILFERVGSGLTAESHPDRLLVTVEHYYGGEMKHVEQFVHTARLAAEHCVFSSLYDIIYPVYRKRVRCFSFFFFPLNQSINPDAQYLSEDCKFKIKMAEFDDISTSDIIDNPKFWLLDDKLSTVSFLLF